MTKSIGIVGARGYVGAELLRRIASDPALRLACVGSRALAGQPVTINNLVFANLLYEDLTPADLGRKSVDAWVLALPNGESARWVAAIDKEVVCVDLSTDHRTDDAWVYGLPELSRAPLRSARRIANPGCYATATNLALAPFVNLLDESATPSAFGVSGWSGAGTTPTPRNDEARLHESLMPYSLVKHSHEPEIARALGRRVRLLPHVAGFARGLSVTVSARLSTALSVEECEQLARDRYRGEPLVVVGSEAPELKGAVRSPRAFIGGFAVDGRDLAVVCTLDNLLKGAATQAQQNLHLALGLDEHAGIA